MGKSDRFKNMPQLNTKQVHGLFILSLWLLSLFAFLFLGADGYVLFDDSGSYIGMEHYVEGVMPIYPLFLRGNRILFGEMFYLQAVIVEQAVFAGGCLILFTDFIRKKFVLKYGEAYFIYFLTLLPFATDMPEAMTTQEILTEGIAYAVFYIFMLVLLQAVWTKNWKWIVGVFFVTLFLSSLRSQLQILFGVCGIIFFYITICTRKEKNFPAFVGRFFLGLAGCIIISFLGIWCTSRISVLYQTKLHQHNLQIQMEMNQADGTAENVVKQEEQNEAEKEKQQDGKSNIVAGQYTSLIFSRGMYEADYEDYLLFEEEELKELYLYLYETADKEKCRYVYAIPGLWIWKDIVGGIGSVGVKCFYAQNEYYSEKPEIINDSSYRLLRNERQIQIGITLLKRHWTRALYHTILLLPSAFICTVFYQIAPIYSLCHFVTLFLYVSAIGLMIWAFIDKKIDRAYAEFMAVILGTNIVMVLIISLVFFGQQRYLVYNFGIFYVIYFLILLQLWKIYGKNWLLKWIKRKES